MRIVIAGVLGGLVLFFWGFVSHMFLPLGEMGHEMPKNEDAVLAVLKENLGEEGYYFVPGISAEQYEDPAALAAYGKKASANPYAFILYQPQGRDDTNMGPMLVMELVTNLLSAILAAWIVNLAGVGFLRRLLLATSLGLFAWLVVSVPQWNWFRFPLDMTVGSLVMTVVGWFLAGLPMAWWLGRQPR
ncbi:MAG: hypothetical protein KA187_04400 [Arenimonas sp.]|nr:hypothetical protein [Arenimonas sp.]MBP6626638.1 hypothetical protein [Arenimonas sp.]